VERGVGMGFTVQYNQKNRFLIGHYTGTMDPGARDEYAQAIVQAGEEFNCKSLLNDMSQVKIDFSTMEIFDLPKVLDCTGIDRSWKRAIIFSTDFDDFRFLETRMVNEGHTVRLFQDRKAAIKWLMEGREE